MKRSRFHRKVSPSGQKFEIVFVIGCIFFLQICCQEQLEVAKAPKPALTESKPALTESKPVIPASTTAPAPRKQQPAKAKMASDANKPAPEITFEKLVHDFGEIGAGTRNTCEFKFANTGNALLKIIRIQTCCGVIARLVGNKKEYAPGESGTLTVSYRASRYPGSTTKRLYLYSNVKASPKVALTIKARIAMKVAHQPERLNLLLKGEDAGCPQITLTSRDKQPFAITRFKSTGDSITADFDPKVTATKFVLKPKVDIEKLRKGLRGQVEIGLTHPECKTVSIDFDTLAEFKVDPRVIYVREAEPQKPVTKKVWIFSNYGEDFEVESAPSRKGTVKVLTQKKVSNGYQFELEITPPAAKTKTRVFTDVFSVKLKGGQQFQITCYGIYARKPGKSSS